MSAQKPVVKSMPLPGPDDIGSYEQILGDRFVNAGRLSAVDLERARRLQSENDESLAKILVKSGLVSEQDAAAALADLLGLPLTSPDDYPDLPFMEDSFSARFLKHKQVIPVSTQGDELIISIADPFDHYVIEAVRMSSGKTVNCQVGLPSEIDAAIERLYGAGKSQMDQIVESVSAVEEQGNAGGYRSFKRSCQ